MGGNSNDWDGEDRRKNGHGASVFERHLQTVVGVVATAAIIWMGTSLIELNKEQVRTSTQLAQVREDMRQLQDQYIRGTADRYTGSDARRDNAAQEIRIQKLEDRVDRLDRKGLR